MSRAPNVSSRALHLSILISATGIICAAPKEEISITSGYIDVRGSEATYSARTDQKPGYYFSIDEASWSDTIAQDSELSILLSAVPDWGRYTLEIGLTDPGWGEIELNYEEYQVGYEGVGAYLPTTGELYKTDPSLLWIKRRLFEISTTLSLDEVSSLIINYRNKGRTGHKNATIWGENTNGLLNSEPERAIVPSNRKIDEETHTLEVAYERNSNQSSSALRYRYDHTSIDNELYLSRDIADPETERKVTEKHQSSSHSSSLKSYTSHQLNDLIGISAAASLTVAETQQEGDRIYGEAFRAPYDISIGVRQSGDIGYRNLKGSSDVRQLIINANVFAKPIQNLRITLSSELEKITRETQNNYLETDIARQPPTYAFAGRESFTESASDNDFDQVSLRLEARYSGFNNLNLYLRGSGYYGDGYIEESSESTLVHPTAGGVEPRLDRKNEYTRKSQSLTSGFSWYPKSNLTVTAQYRHERRDNRYTPLSTYRSARDRLLYPNYLKRHQWVEDSGSTNLRIRLLKGLTVSSKASLTHRDLNTQSVDSHTIQSGSYKAFTASESIRWSVSKRITLQANASWSEIKLTTPSNYLINQNSNLITESSYTLIYGSLDLSWNTSESTTLRLHYSYLNTDTFDNNSEVSVGYGNELDESVIELSLQKRFSEKLRTSIGYSYQISADKAFPGTRDFTAHGLFFNLSYLY
jgi:hypothetical protein